MNNLLTKNTDEEGEPSLTSNGQRTALEADEESESKGLPKGLHNVKLETKEELVADITPIGNLVTIVNENLKNCTSCKKCPLKLGLDHRIGLASSWKLSCSSCEKLDAVTTQRIRYLKRKSGAVDQKERCRLGEEVSQLKCKLNKKGNGIKISSPLVKDRTDKHKRRRTTDYEINVRGIIASLYIGTGGMDIGLVASCLGLKGGKYWERTFTRHSKKICKSIMKVVNKTVNANLKEEIDLTI